MSKISVLALARKHSKYLSNYVLNFLNMTSNHEDTDLWIMGATNDDWNKDLYKYVETIPNIHCCFENREYGKYGRHIFFNELSQKCAGDWILHTCDDQRFILEGWDNRVRDFIIGKDIDYNKINIVIPMFDNIGSVDHILSRAYVNTLQGLGKHPNIDSYINFLLQKISDDRIHHMYYPQLMHDYTPQSQFIDSPEYLKTSEKNKHTIMPTLDFKADYTTNNIIKDAQTIMEAIKNGL